VRGEDNGPAELMLLDELPEQAPVERVQATRRLVPKRAQKSVKVIIRGQG
jgi:hypothetical protein